MVILDPNAVISEAKLTRYLLVFLEKDDKSQFLAQAGYTLENWQELEQDLREQILSLEATPTTQTQYGQKFSITGDLAGRNPHPIRVKTIWMQEASLDLSHSFPLRR